MPCKNCQAEEMEEETEVEKLWDPVDEEEDYQSPDKCDVTEPDETNDSIVLPPMQKYISLTVMKKKVKCDSCDKWLLPTSLAAHKVKHAGKRFFCDICSSGFNYKYALKLHMKHHYKVNILYFLQFRVHPVILS